MPFGPNGLLGLGILPRSLYYLTSVSFHYSWTYSPAFGSPFSGDGRAAIQISFELVSEHLGFDLVVGKVLYGHGAFEVLDTTD